MPEQETKQEERKPWYTSKTLWTNIIAVGSIFVRSQYGFVLSPEEEVAILGFINIILRIITKQGIQ